ncbi:MAG: hypothetical protein KatS3mg052_2348 [Candidatus Roseilinea sp.]|nr:MAG: hypothetical protein KatS3mg052_2348 [Candidatus Roseilinea sp.]
MGTMTTVGPGEAFLIGVACLLVVMPIASAVGIALRRRRRRQPGKML